MLSYTYSLTKEQLDDCSKKYRAKTLKPLIWIAVAFFVLFCAIFALSFVDGLGDIRAASFTVLILDLFVVLVIVFSRRGSNSNNDLYFKSCQTDGVVDYEFQLCETEFVVLQPKKGNVHHYLYESIVKVCQLEGYAAVLLSGNQFLPVLINEHTQPLINSLQSLAKNK